MPLIGVKNELMNHQLQIIPVQGLPLKSTWYLTWLSEKKSSPVAKAFMNFIKTEKKKIIEEHFSWFEEY